MNVQQNLTITPETQGYWLIWSEKELLIQYDEKEPSVPYGSWKDFSFAHHYQKDVIRIGDIEGKPCFLIDMGQETAVQDRFTGITLREFISQTTPHWFGMVARSHQLAVFLQTHRFCGQCGDRMHNVGWEMAMQCKTCQHRAYPRISPCIIVAITDGNNILLARGKHHKAGLYSILAGFVESGETLEQAVHREVMEEVGIRIKHVRYIESQPWPFPHQLMCGFVAEYDSGDITIDQREIIEADWFPLNSLPTTPSKETISGRLIALSLAQQ